MMNLHYQSRIEDILSNAPSVLAVANTPSITILEQSSGENWQALRTCLTHEEPHQSTHHTNDSVWMSLSFDEIPINRSVNGIRGDFVAPAKSVCVAPPHSIVDVEIREPIYAVHYELSKSILLNTSQEVFDRDLDQINLPNLAGCTDSFVINLLDTIFSLSGQNNLTLSGMAVEQLSNTLSQTILLKLSPDISADDLPTKKGGFTPLQIKLINELFDEQINGDLTIASMSRLVGCSRTSFIQKFKHDFEASPRQYILARRINYACKLIEGSKIPLSEIAWKCGFTDSSHFTKAFISRMGHTPQQYRNRLR